jgi:hypothetical protein
MNPGMISSELNWKAKLGLAEIVERMFEGRLL